MIGAELYSYGARLPELTSLICKKLGGPKKTSPKRPPLTKSASSCATLKQDASLQRQQIRKPRRTLERVLTDERSASQKPPPALSRSATVPVLPQVKREVSDTSLSSIPLNRVAMHKRYSQREVDLHATSQAAEARLKKKAQVEQELQDAIATLKKPNPRMAVKEIVEGAERRSTASHSRSTAFLVQVYLFHTECPQNLRIRFAILSPKALKLWLRRATIDTKTFTAVFHVYHGNLQGHNLNRKKFRRRASLVCLRPQGRHNNQLS